MAASTATTIAEVLFEPSDIDLKFLPEGPFDLGDERFSWVGIQHGANARYGSLNIFDTKTGQNKSYRLPGRPGFQRPTSNPSQFLIGAERELGIFDIQTEAWSPICSGVDAGVENTIINDATTWQDSVIFGCKDLEFKTKKAGLYLYRRNPNKLIQLRNDQICSNGKAIIERKDGRLMLLDIDTPTRKIVRYELDIDAGRLRNEVTAIDLGNATGFPDGMVLTPDAKSCIVSFYNPDDAPFGLTQQFSLATGQLERSWQTPDAPQNTCPLILKTAAGPKLVITTAIEHMPSERQKKATKSGCLFIADL